MCKRFLAILLTLILAFSIVACNSKGDDATEPTNHTQDTPTSGDSESIPPDEPTPSYPSAAVPETLRILAIGNSFSVDAMEYLYQIAADAGVKTIILGNLRYSGCTLTQHYNFATTDAPEYTYFKNTTGSWVSMEGYKFSQGVTDEDWDYITLQQGSPSSGIPAEYEHLEELVAMVETMRTNPDAKLFWHMTWAYQQNTGHKNFSNYNSDQMTMYRAIVDTTQSEVLPVESFVGVIPSGTIVQNARTSFMGDNICRDDGYHMSQPYGRYLVGLTYFAAITGADISEITYRPAASITDEMVEMSKESVKNAMLHMYEVTESTFKERTEEEKGPTVGADDLKEYLQADTTLAASQGIDLSGYTLLEYEYLTNQYYNSTSGIAPRASSSGQNEKHICFKNRYTKEQLLNAVVICDEGWQYRPEAWANETDKASTRPGMCSQRLVVLDDAYWGNNVLLAFNISALPQRSLAANYAEAATHVRIYVPTR